MRTKGFIFDLDGTLIDSMGVWESIGEQYLRKNGVTHIPADFTNIIKTMDLAESALFIKNEFQLPFSPGEIRNQIVQFIEDQYRYHIPLKKGVREFLERNAGVQMCIATATDQALAAAVLKRLCIDRYFSFVLTTADVGCGKDRPDIFLKAAKMLGLKNDEVLIFEDSLHAVETAKRAGFCVAAVYDDVAKNEQDALKSIADIYLTDLNELDTACVNE